MPELPAGTVTFLFTDIQGSTKLLKQLHKDYIDLLSKEKRIMRSTFDEWGGQEVDTQGDSFFVSFPRATEAVAAVVEIQKTLAAFDWPEGVSVHVRMGMHTGEPWLVEEGYVGMDVHRAARVGHAGHGGQVLLSETTAALVRDELPEGVCLVDLGRHRLKDMRRPERIHQLVIEGLPETFPPLTSEEYIEEFEVSSPDGDPFAKTPRQVGISPYRGLAAFRESDSDFFFGREQFTEQLVESLQHRQLVAVVVGSSGSGKSSLVYAGLLPHLSVSEPWAILSFRPGTDPFLSLAGEIVKILEPDLGETERVFSSQRLADGIRSGEVTLFHTLERLIKDDEKAGRILLFIDQFEELYTLVSDPEIREGFLDEIIATSARSLDQRPNPFVFLLTLRADFMGQALTHRPFADALQDGSMMLGPMNREELHAAIEKPAAMQGAAFDPGLVTRILDDVGEEPGNLPLLEFALTLLWERLDQGWLTHAVYEEIGQVEGALANYADEVYASLSPIEQEQTRKAFVQLVQPGQGTEDTRRIANREDLAGVDWGLIQHLADRRLIVTGLDEKGVETVEVVHEALIRGWGLLRSWMAADREFRTWQEGLRAALRAWENSGRDYGALLRGAPLAQAQEWLDTRRPDLSSAEIEYIHTSSMLRLATQARRERRRRLIIGGLVAGMVIALLLAGIAFNQSSVAENNAQLALQNEATATNAQGQALIKAATATAAQGEAQQQAERADAQAARADLEAANALVQKDAAEAEARAAQEAYSLSLAANAKQALDNKDPMTGLALASEAIRLDDPPVLAQEILRAAAYAPGPKRIFENTGDIYDMAVSPDGKLLLTGLYTGEMGWWDFEQGVEILRDQAHPEWINSVDFHPDGSLALSASDDGLIKLWDVETGEEIGNLEGHSGIVQMASFSPDGERILSSGGSWEAPELILWRVEDQEEIHRFGGNIEPLVGFDYEAVFTPDGLKAVTARNAPNGDGLVIVWDIETGEALNHVVLPSGMEAVAVSPDGQFILAGTYQGITYLLDLNTLEEIGSFEQSGIIRSVAFIPNSRLALVGNASGLVIWDLNELEIVSHFRPKPTNPHKLVFTPDSRRVISIFESDSLMEWDLFGADELRRFEGHNSAITGLNYHPDGNHFFSSAGINNLYEFIAEEYTLRLWDLETGQPIKIINGQYEGEDLGWFIGNQSPDGNTALVGTTEGLVRMWDLDTGEQTQILDGHKDYTWVIETAFSPDGKQALSAPFQTDDDEPILWDLETGEVIHRLHGHNSTSIVTIAISPDGRTGLSGDFIGSIIHWDLENGEQIRRFNDHNQMIAEVAFTPDGTRAVSTSSDASIILWDVWTGEIIRKHTTPNQDQFWKGLAISPDGKQALASIRGGPLLLWDLETGEELRRFYGHTDSIWDVAISPDGTRALSGGQDFSIIEWQLATPTLDELTKWISENRYIREFTCEERELYQVPPLCEEETVQAPTSSEPPADVLARTLRPLNVAKPGENIGFISEGDFEIWVYEGQAGETINIRLVADNPGDFDLAPDEWAALDMMDMVLRVIGPNDELLAYNDDAEGEELTTNSLIENLVLPADYPYRIEARSFNELYEGMYTLIIEIVESP